MYVGSPQEFYDTF